MNKIKQYLINRNQKRNIKKSKYRLSEISKIKQAKIIDFINEFCIKYYVREHNTKPSFYAIEDEVYSRFKLHSVGTELLINIMLKYKYITEKKDEDEKLIEFTCNTNGFDLYFKGGLTRKIRKEKSTRILLIIGSISSGLVGLYYLWLLLTDLNKTLHIICF
jgi:hypothetical protein